MALALAAMLGSFACAGEGANSEPRPNIVLISVDTLRADRLGAYGYGKPTSPSIDRLAREGVVFETMIAETSWTLPSHATMFTGLSSLAHQVERDWRRLPDAHRTLAESLRAAGYRTRALVSGPYLHPVFGLAQGFESYEILGESIHDVEGFEHDKLEEREWKERYVDLDKASHRTQFSDELAALTAEHLAELADAEPFFLFVHMFDVHSDYAPPEAHWRLFDPDYSGTLDTSNYVLNDDIHAGMAARDLQYVQALYDGEIHWTDEHIGTMLDALDVHGLTQNTLVALTSDHGEEFFEHGDKDHRKTLFDEQLLVPFVLRLPARLPSGVRVPTQVRMLDIAPTLLDVAGIADPPFVMGRSLLPFIEEPALREDLPAVSFLMRPGEYEQASLRLGKLKFLNVVSYAGAGEDLIAFDLEADPGETQPLTLTAGHRLLLQLGIAPFLEQEAAWRERIPMSTEYTLEAPDSVRRSLEALGYVSGSEDG